MPETAQSRGRGINRDLLVLVCTHEVGGQHGVPELTTPGRDTHPCHTFGGIRIQQQLPGKHSDGPIRSFVWMPVPIPYLLG